MRGLLKLKDATRRSLQEKLPTFYVSTFCWKFAVPASKCSAHQCFNFVSIMRAHLSLQKVTPSRDKFDIVELNGNHEAINRREFENLLPIRRTSNKQAKDLLMI